MIAIVDYGLGNIKAFYNVFKKLNIPVIIANDSNAVKSASKIVLPGVGAFDHAMSRLNDSGMREILDELVLVKKKPILGICVGMQMLAKSSEEGALPGLGWIDGLVKKFDTSKLNQKTHLPHMGWNTIEPNFQHPLLNEMDNTSRFYFLHSFYFEVSNPTDSLAKSTYGMTFTSAVSNNNIHGVQFHPEKSHANGIQLLKNFSNL